MDRKYTARLLYKTALMGATKNLSHHANRRLPPDAPKVDNADTQFNRSPCTQFAGDPMQAIRCGFCQQKLQIQPEYAGKRVRCSLCGTVVQVPRPEPDAQAEAPDFDGLDDGPAVSRLTSHEHQHVRTQATAPAAASTNASTRKKRRRARVRAAPRRDRPEGSTAAQRLGVTCVVLGLGSYLLPLAGLQWRLFNFAGDEFQSVGGPLLSVIGALVVLRSYWHVSPGGSAAAFLGILGAMAFLQVYLPAGNPAVQIVAADPADPEAADAPAPNNLAPPAGAPEDSSPARAAAPQRPWIRLSRGVLVTERRIGLPQVSFSVDYRFTGRPPYDGQYFWVVQSPDGLGHDVRPFFGMGWQLKRQGQLQITVEQIGPATRGSYRCWLEVGQGFGPALHPDRSRASNVITLQRAANLPPPPVAASNEPPPEPLSGPSQAQASGSPRLSGPPSDEELRRIGELAAKKLQERLARIQRQGKHKIVTVLVTGLTRDATQSAIVQELRRASGKAEAVWYRNEDPMRVLLAPVGDVKAFSDKIDLGEVTAVDQDKRVVNLTVDESALPPELLADDPLSQALVDLKSNDFVRRRSAAIQLRRLRPTQKKQEVARLLEKMLKDPDPQACKFAAEALGVWGTEESVPLLIELLGENSVFVRWAAIDALGTLKDPRAAEAVAARLTEQKDARKAALALQQLGPAAEDAVLPYLEHHHWQVRVQVCHLLKEIGTKKSVPALRALTRRRRGSDFLVAVAAAEALEAAGTRAAPSKKDPAP